MSDGAPPLSRIAGERFNVDAILRHFEMAIIDDRAGDRVMMRTVARLLRALVAEWNISKPEDQIALAFHSFQQPCRSCKRPIVWMMTRNRKRIPVDAHTTNATDDVHDPAFDPSRHQSHFATCPQADQWRQPKPETKES